MSIKLSPRRVQTRWWSRRLSGTRSCSQCSSLGRWWNGGGQGPGSEWDLHWSPDYRTYMYIHRHSMYGRFCNVGMILGVILWDFVHRQEWRQQELMSSEPITRQSTLSICYRMFNRTGPFWFESTERLGRVVESFVWVFDSTHGSDWSVLRCRPLIGDRFNSWVERKYPG